VRLPRVVTVLPYVLQTGVLSTNHEPSVQRAAAAYTTLCQMVNEKHPNCRALRTAFWVRSGRMWDLLFLGV
jgi:hypothetical protein